MGIYRVCKSAKLLIAILLFLSICCLYTVAIVYSESPNVLAPIQWVKYIDLTKGRDYAYGSCLFGGYIAVVGVADDTPAIVLLDMSTSDVVNMWRGDRIEVLINCISIGNLLYVVGYENTFISSYGVIYVFDKDLNVVRRIEVQNTPLYTITYSDGYIYIGGYTRKDINLDGYNEDIWYIEKRSPDLNPINNRVVYIPNWKWGYTYDIGVNPLNRNIWVVGYYTDYNYSVHSLAILLDKNLNIVKYIDYPINYKYYLGSLYAIDFDANGYAYIVGSNGIAKMDPNGNIVDLNKEIWGTYGAKIVYTENFIYIFRDEYTGTYIRHNMYIMNKNMYSLAKYVLSSNIEADSTFDLGKHVFDGSNIYVAGYDYATMGGNSRWVIYSISTIYPVQQTVVTKTITTTAMQTISIPITITSTYISLTTITSIFTTTSISTTTLEKTATATTTIATPSTTTTTITTTTTTTQTITTSITTPTTVTTTIKEAVIPPETISIIAMAIVVIAIIIAFLLRK
ncbi:hypothetical protein Igag_0674 [Ignisphaera aggregans DSM 17230]|uniref:Uncharacterized protein n=1 Tax=Ignisphaera aggregans (strain DSM 17230 / JCM 13409 / AQ1.S1) TaxID=583356 RepID=E0SSV4_IGNAA|nr:hypothetical protein Igag_0674 [Ignisphaera aggregans DSM 17230]